MQLIDGSTQLCCLTLEQFTSHLEAHLATTSAPSSALFRVGLGRVEAVRDLLGTEIHNSVLELAGRRLQGSLRGKDTVVRLHEHEYAVLLEELPSDLQAQAVASRLCDLMQRTYLVQGQVANLGVNIGIAFCERDAGATRVLREAGIALHAARVAGSGTVRVFDVSIEEQAHRRGVLMADLRKALLLKQLEVHYQPQIDAVAGGLNGFEALLRWAHPRLGWISPGEFIPIAEDLNLIGRIGDWVMKTACVQATQLPQHIVMAVNASPLQFSSGSFASSVGRALQDAGLPANRLEVEITEGVFVKNEKNVLASVNDLRAAGVRLAMDDFGTGYASLSQLASLPFDTIKIDRSLVGGSPKQRAIVRAIATLGSGMGMTTLAEGIETTDQLEKARADGCLSAQGYLFGKAMPPDRLADFISRFPSPAKHLEKRGA